MLYKYPRWHVSKQTIETNGQYKSFLVIFSKFWGNSCVYLSIYKFVCVCVCVREREKEWERKYVRACTCVKNHSSSKKITQASRCHILKKENLQRISFKSHFPFQCCNPAMESTVSSKRISLNLSSALTDGIHSRPCLRLFNIFFTFHKPFFLPFPKLFSPFLFYTYSSSLLDSCCLIESIQQVPDFFSLFLSSYTFYLFHFLHISFFMKNFLSFYLS